jgi:uncharacterized protein (TIGR02996 family)
MAGTDPFIRAIQDRPADDAPRLVLADYLEEQGSAQGEFIRLQCERARLDPADPRVPALLAREEELLRSHRADWLRPMHALLRPTKSYPGLPLQHAEFRRGLVEAIRVDAAAFVWRAADLMHVGPVREVCLVAMIDGGRQTARLMADLGRLDCWGRVEVLGLRLWHWTDAAVTKFLAVTHMPYLRELRLYGDAIGQPVVRALLAWPGMNQLGRVAIRTPATDMTGLVSPSDHRRVFDFQP